MSTTTVKEKKPNWFIAFLSSTIGKKLLMALTGIFLILFLTVHLIGNLQLLIPLWNAEDGGRAFNEYAHFMGHNELIQIVSKGNFFFILLHIVVAIILTIYNKKARPVSYAYSKPSANSTFTSRNMFFFGSILLVFIAIHLVNFWGRAKFGEMPMTAYAGGEEIQNLYIVVLDAFTQPWLVAIYVVGMFGLAFHLAHGFQSAFQTVGLNHVKYTGFINTLGLIYSIVVPLLFAIIPILMYVKSLG